ncbi:MAG: TraM recognition domain-containing protein, partial [Solirubrobacteraceae bacterium]
MTFAVLALAIVRGWLQWRTRHQPTVTYALIPPAEVKVEQTAWLMFYRRLFGISAPWWKRLVSGQPWLSLEFWSANGRVSARCWFPERLETIILTHLRMTLPGMEVSRWAGEPELGEPAARARLHFWREDLYGLGGSDADQLRPVLGSLSLAPQGVVQLVITPDVRWQTRAQQRWAALSGQATSPGIFTGVMAELVDICFGWLLPKRPAAASPSPLIAMPAPGKAREPGYRAEFRLRVSASSKADAKGIMQTLTSAFRSLDDSNGLRPRRVLRRRRFDRDIVRRRPPSDRGPVLVAEELARLFHLPVTGISMDAAATRVPPSHAMPLSGKTLCLADALNNAPITISQADCRQHIHVLGPTGSGKSTLLMNLALEDIRAGRGVGVIDPKGDLVRALLERIPEDAASRLVLVDPTFREYPIGLNVLDCPDPDERELVCDAIVTIFRKTYERFWGPRTDDILRAAVLTLLRKPGATLCEIPILLLDPVVRQKLTVNLRDPVGLKPFWDEYEALAEGHRLQLIGPVLNKLRTFLLRPTMRNILGQSISTVQLSEVLDGRGILLVCLAKGLLGEETSRLLGSFIVARLWQAAMHRADRVEEQRPDFNLYLDEFHNYLHLPQSLDEVLAEARGYRLNLVLANQHLAQLSASTREALAANARTRVVFQCGQDDAHYLAREFEPALTRRDLQSLQRFQAAVRLSVAGHTEPPFTGVTAPAPPSL